MEEICTEDICRRCGSFAARLLGAAIRCAGKVWPATFPGRYRDLLCGRYHDGAGGSMGVDCQRRTAREAAAGVLFMVTWLEYDDQAGLGQPIASSLPDGAECGNVQPGNLRDDS